MLKYNPEWMIAVLEDLREFADANEMPKSSMAIAKAIIVAQVEFSDLAANDDRTLKGGTSRN